MRKPTSLRATQRLVVAEMRSKFTLVCAVTARVEKIRVADRLPMRPGQKQCDYIFVEEDTQAVYVELKGSDIPSAVQQLRSTLAHLPLPVPAKLFFIIHHHCPYPATKVAQFKKEFLRQTGFALRVERTPHEHTL